MVVSGIFYVSMGFVGRGWSWAIIAAPTCNNRKRTLLLAAFDVHACFARGINSLTRIFLVWTDHYIIRIPPERHGGLAVRPLATRVKDPVLKTACERIFERLFIHPAKNGYLALSLPEWEIGDGERIGWLGTFTDRQYLTNDLLNLTSIGYCPVLRHVWEV